MSDKVEDNMQRAIRNKKLSAKDRLAIIDLYNTGSYSMAELGKMFNVHKSRISHIVNDTYNEIEGCRDETN